MDLLSKGHHLELALQHKTNKQIRRLQQRLRSRDQRSLPQRYARERKETHRRSAAPLDRRSWAIEGEASARAQWILSATDAAGNVGHDEGRLQADAAATGAGVGHDEGHGEVSPDGIHVDRRKSSLANSTGDRVRQDDSDRISSGSVPTTTSWHFTHPCFD